MAFGADGNVEGLGFPFAVIGLQRKLLRFFVREEDAMVWLRIPFGGVVATRQIRFGHGRQKEHGKD